MGKHKLENYKLIAIKYYEFYDVSQKDHGKYKEIVSTRRRTLKKYKT